MVTIDDLKESLRAQLATLIDLYEAESSPAAGGLAESRAPTTAHGAAIVLDGAVLALDRPAGAMSPLGPDIGALAAAEGRPAAAHDVAQAVEFCLRAFAAAIAAAESAAAAAGDVQALASGLLQRAADSRGVALMMRRDSERRLRDLALGRVVPSFEAHRLAEAQAAARLSATLARQSEAEATLACARAREAAQWAAAALVAACRADPARANPDFAPEAARTALADAAAAATRARHLAAEANQSTAASRRMHGDTPSKGEADA